MNDTNVKQSQTPALTTGLSQIRSKTSWGELFTTLIPFIVLAILVLMVTMRQPTFLSTPGLRSLLLSLAPILLLAIGQMFVILTGGIDLSFATTASFGTVLLAMWLPGMGPVGIVVMLIVLTATGFLNGFIVAKGQVPSFIVTLGALGLYSGLGLWLSGASTIRVSEGFEVLAALNDLRIAQMPAVGVFAIVAAVVVSVLMIILKRGRILHAMGLAEPAVLMSGVSTVKVRIFAFAACSFFAGLAAIVMVAGQRSGGPTLADTLQLPAIAAVVVGGTAITGGVGGAMRTVVGAFIIVVLRIGLTAVGVDPSYEQIVYGFVIIAAVAVTIDRSRLRAIK